MVAAGPVIYPDPSTGNPTQLPASFKYTGCLHKDPAAFQYLTDEYENCLAVDGPVNMPLSYQVAVAGIQAELTLICREAVESENGDPDLSNCHLPAVPNSCPEPDEKVAGCDDCFEGDSGVIETGEGTEETAGAQTPGGPDQVG